MPIRVGAVEIFGNPKLGALVAKEIQTSLRGKGIPTEDWELQIRTANAQLLLTCRGPHRRFSLSPAWTFEGTEGGPDGELYVYHAAVEVGSASDLTPAIAKTVDMIRELLT